MSKLHKTEEEWIGQKFGKGTVIKKLGEFTKLGSPHQLNGKRYTIVYDELLLKCDCGQEYKANTKNLVQQAKPTKSCGCLRRGDDLIGKKFGLGTVISFSHNGKRGKTPVRSTVVWNLKCDCGNNYQTCTEMLVNGDVSSCGCAKSKFHCIITPQTIGRWWKRVNIDSKKRGHSCNISKEYCLQLLIDQNFRCKLTGLTISIEDGTASLDRIHSEIGYEPGNVQWIYRKVNFMKNTLNQDEFIKLCSLVSSYSSQ